MFCRCLTCTSFIKPESTSFTFFQIIVRTIDGTLFLAKEDYVDYHYNLLILKVKSTIELKVVDLRCRQADVVEGMNVIALGRAFHTCLLFDTTGELYLEYPNFGCEELLRSTCGFSKVFSLFLFYLVYENIRGKCVICFTLPTHLVIT